MSKGYLGGFDYIIEGLPEVMYNYEYSGAVGFYRTDGASGLNGTHRFILGEIAGTTPEDTCRVRAYDRAAFNNITYASSGGDPYAADGCPAVTSEGTGFHYLSLAGVLGTVAYPTVNDSAVYGSLQLAYLVIYGIETSPDGGAAYDIIPTDACTEQIWNFSIGYQERCITGTTFKAAVKVTYRPILGPAP